MRRLLLTSCALAVVCQLGAPSAQTTSPTLIESSRQLLRDLVGINTAEPDGSTTIAATRVAEFSEVRGVSRRGRPGGRRRRATWQPGRTAARPRDRQARALPGAPGRRARHARGLDHRSLFAGRERRLLLRARDDRRQAVLRDLCSRIRAAEARGLRPRARPGAGADDRRGKWFRRAHQRRDVAAEASPAARRCGLRRQRRCRRRRHCARWPLHRIRRAGW